MKSFLFCVVLLASTTVMVAQDGTAPAPTPVKSTPQITLVKAPDVVDPLGAPISITPATRTAPETTDSSKLPLPVLRVDGHLPVLTLDSSASQEAEQPLPQPKTSKLWVTSMLAFAGGTTLDGISSWHQRESNPILSSANGTFEMRGVLIKAGLAAFVLVPQLIHPPKDDKTRKIMEVINFADAAVYTGVAMHNYSMH